MMTLLKQHHWLLVHGAIFMPTNGSGLSMQWQSISFAITIAVSQWRENIEAQMTDHELERFRLLADYMLEVDGKTVQCMSDGEVKLSLFISNQKGCGKLLLQEMMDEFLHRDLRHLYLWTDTSCTHEYYPQHGFTLVGQFLSEVYDSYAPGYTTYIYKKGISSESK